MKRLIIWLRSIWGQRDKWMHIAAGMAVASWAAILCPGQAWWLPVTAAALAGGLKELRDRMGYGTPDVDDFWATLAGGAVVWAAVIARMFLQIITG